MVQAIHRRTSDDVFLAGSHTRDVHPVRIRMRPRLGSRTLMLEHLYEQQRRFMPSKNVVLVVPTGCLCVVLLVAGNMYGSLGSGAEQGVSVQRTSTNRGTSEGTSRANAQERAVTSSVANYATGEFVAGCLVHPQELQEHELLGCLPIDFMTPDPLSIRRLEEMEFEQLAVFCGPVDPAIADDRDVGAVEWAAAARLSKKWNLEDFIAQWHRTVVPAAQLGASVPEPIEIGGLDCFRVPAGTLLPTTRRYGSLKFLNRDGEVAVHGVNVGRVYDHRSYFQSDTLSAAIFSLDQIRESDFDFEHLSIEVRFDVFLTHRLSTDVVDAQIELRNPSSGVRSAPLAFQPVSYSNQSINLPRSLTVVEDGKNRDGDLFDDLVSDGRLEFIVTVNGEGIFLGAGSRDLNVRALRYDYVLQIGRDVIVAQSPQTLQKMVEAFKRPTELATQLAEPISDVRLVVQADDVTKRETLRRLTRLMPHQPLLALAGRAMIDLQFDLSSEPTTSARCVARFDDESGTRIANLMYRQLLVRATQHARVEIGDRLERLDVIHALSRFASRGVSMSFPNPTEMSADAREESLLGLIDDALDAIQVKSDGATLEFQFTQPERFQRLTTIEQYALANIQEILAADLFSRERLDLGDEMYERVTDRFPNDSPAWFRRAHQLSFNVSVEFDRNVTRYAWIHAGIDLMLDGVDRNPDSIDLVWMVAQTIARRIGEADDRVAFRQLFAGDKEIQQRLSKIVDPRRDDTHSGTVDSWLVARRMFEYCIEATQETHLPKTIPPLLFYTRPADSQVRYAQALDEEGKTAEAREAWKVAESLYRELGKRPIQITPDATVRLDDWPTRLEEYGQDDPRVEHLAQALTVVQYDYWLAKTKLEQDEEFAAIRKVVDAFNQSSGDLDREEKRRLCVSLLMRLENLREPYERELSCVGSDFRVLADTLRQLQLEFTEKLDESLEPIIELIEDAAPVSEFPFIDLLQSEWNRRNNEE